MTVCSNEIRLCLLAALRGKQRMRNIRSLSAIIAKGLCFVLISVGCAHQKVPVLDSHPTVAISKRADFKQEHKSENARRMADWVVDSGDNQGMPFVIVDKVDARVFVFDADGQLKGAAPVLLGLARGDDTIPGIGNRKMSEIRAEERITPAGRFLASLGYNFHGKDILWVDYDDALSLHRVVTSNPKERRLERLASPKPLDHRISYGCINVPAEFYDHAVKPTFTGTYGVVYVLPEIRSNSEIFRSYYDVESRWRNAATGP
jgi:hypothetical protein